MLSWACASIKLMLNNAMIPSIPHVISLQCRGGGETLTMARVVSCSVGEIFVSRKTTTQSEREVSLHYKNLKEARLAS